MSDKSMPISVRAAPGSSAWYTSIGTGYVPTGGGNLELMGSKGDPSATGRNAPGAWRGATEEKTGAGCSVKIVVTPANRDAYEKLVREAQVLRELVSAYNTAVQSFTRVHQPSVEGASLSLSSGNAKLEAAPTLLAAISAVTGEF